MTEIHFDRRFKSRLKGRFEKYDFEVGILKDRPHRTALNKSSGLKSFAGGPARKVGFGSTVSIAQVSKYLRKITGVNIFTRPAKPGSKNNADIKRLFKDFFNLSFGRSTTKRMENTLQALVRNPILRGDYGKNTKQTADRKGFNRKFIDTAQLFRAISARVRAKRV